MPYICQTRSDIPEGVIQVLDLRPNTSQRNLIYDPPGQTKYVRRPQNDTVVTSGSGPIVTAAEYKGVAAWLIDTIEDTPNGDALTATQANTIADALISRMESGLKMETSDVNTVIASTVAGSGIGVGNSVGTLAEILAILAGAEYTLPAGSEVDSNGSTFVASAAGTLDLSDTYRVTYETGALRISRGEGHLAGFADSSFEYGGTTGAAVVVYLDDGTLLT